jgi:hypothetical protein
VIPREKIARLLHAYWGSRPGDWDGMVERGRQHYLSRADEILVLVAGEELDPAVEWEAWLASPASYNPPSPTMRPDVDWEVEYHRADRKCAGYQTRVIALQKALSEAVDVLEVAPLPVRRFESDRAKDMYARQDLIQKLRDIAGGAQ